MNVNNPDKNKDKKVTTLKESGTRFKTNIMVASKIKPTSTIS